jgi:Flp pilus assembly protein TadG
MVETALSLSLLVFTILGGADMARAFAAQLGVQNAARAAGSRASTPPPRRSTRHTPSARVASRW